MKKLKDKKYIVTAINRITLLREAVSKPVTLQQALSMHRRLLAVKPSSRSYIYPMIQELIPMPLSIQFSPTI